MCAQNLFFCEWQQSNYNKFQPIEMVRHRNWYYIYILLINIYGFLFWSENQNKKWELSIDITSKADFVQKERIPLKSTFKDHLSNTLSQRLVWVYATLNSLSAYCQVDHFWRTLFDCIAGSCRRHILIKCESIEKFFILNSDWRISIIFGGKNL